MMATAVASRSVDTSIGGKRRIIFPILAGLLALCAFIFLDGVREGIAPWSQHVDYDPQPELNKWHHASHGATVGILLGGCMVGLTWQPARKPLLLQMFVLGFATLATVYATEDPSSVVGFGVVLVVAMLALYAVYPNRPALRQLPRPGASKLLLGLTLLAAAGMSPAVVRAFTHVYDEPAFEGAADPVRWGSDIIIMFALVIAGLLVSSKRGGWRVLGVIVGIDFFFLGAAALTIPDDPGSWGVLGGILSIAFAVVWLAALLNESDADRRANAVADEDESTLPASS